MTAAYVAMNVNSKIIKKSCFWENKGKELKNRNQTLPVLNNTNISIKTYLKYWVNIEV